MENASKALIIAGAILLAILIISLGLMVYNGAKDTVNQNNLSETEIGVFNSKWESYLGNNKTSSNVSALCSAAIANNAAEKKLGTNRYIEISGEGIDIAGGEGNAEKTTAPMLPNSSTYKVEVGNRTNGLITKITVSVQNN